MEEKTVNKIKELLWQETEDHFEPQVYVILDAARDEEIFKGVYNSGDEGIVCLYKGKKAKELASAAPYLVKLEKDSPFTQWILEEGWGESWGIFCNCDLPIQKVRDHFRNFLMVVDEEGTPMYFRYYDPRVLQVYLPTCNKEELKTFFGPISRYFVEGDTTAITEFKCVNGMIDENSIEL